MQACDNVMMNVFFRPKQPWFWLSLLLACQLLTACQPPSHQQQAYVFGTLVELQIDDVSSQQAQAAAEAVLARYQQLHQQLHAWLPGELTRLNTALANGKTPVTVSPTLAAILLHAQQLSARTQGLFNPAIGKLVALWGFHHDHFQPTQVTEAQLAPLLHQHPDMQHLTIEGLQVSANNPAIQIDLGGYAKGYALQEGQRILLQHGVQNALINIGGNVLALGQHHGRPWRVGIQHPRQPGALAALDLPSGWAIGTSGDYQRYFMAHGQRYCHILDPRTGKPAQAVQAATVLMAPGAHAGVLSDVASKPLFIAPEQASNMAKSLGVTGWLLVLANGDIQLNRAMQSRLQWLDTQAHTHATLVP